MALLILFIGTFISLGISIATTGGWFLPPFVVTIIVAVIVNQPELDGIAFEREVQKQINFEYWYQEQRAIEYAADCRIYGEDYANGKRWGI